MAWSDYIVFADETGDHGLKNIDPAFPMFGLAFCVIKKCDYVETILPAFQRLKFDYWGHDGVVFHEHELRKQEADFSFLRASAEVRAEFMERLTTLIDEAPVIIHSAVVNKANLTARYTKPWNPYEIALLFCMESLHETLVANGQTGRSAHVVFEGRGRNEDGSLELVFRRITANREQWGYRQHDFSVIEYLPRFEKKACNSIGLQFADLVARPIALRALRPLQENRAATSLRRKKGQWKTFP
ncbi:MAG: DUF3800 domain-containing protein [Micropepsaceae bacterium]